MRNLNDLLNILDEHYLEMLKYVGKNFDNNLQMFEAQKFNAPLYGEAKIIEDCINIFELKLKEDAILTIAKFQPNAKILRKLIMIINSVRILERIGDLLNVNLVLVKKIERKNPQLAYLLSEAVYPLACKIKEIFDMYVKAYSEKDLSLLYEVMTFDEEIEELAKKNFDKFLSVMKEKPENVEAGNLISLIDKKLERISDHIMHLVVDLVYIMNGENIKTIEISQPEDGIPNLI